MQFLLRVIRLNKDRSITKILFVTITILNECMLDYEDQKSCRNK